VVASIWYLLFTSVLSAIQRRIEAHYSRGSSRHVAEDDSRWKRMLRESPLGRLLATRRVKAGDD
jgi:hypothetical protein